MRRLAAAIIAAWIFGAGAATGALGANSGIVAFLLPVFAVVLGLWLLCGGAIVALLRRRERLMPVIEQRPTHRTGFALDTTLTCTMRRLAAAIIAAWIVGAGAATGALGAKSGIVALELLPAFALVLGLWLLCVGAMAALLRRREQLMLIWMYGASVASAFFFAALFFVLFAYPFMVCVPVGMLVAAPTFHTVIYRWRTSAQRISRQR